MNRSKIVRLTIIALLTLAFGVLTISAQPGAGARYGARDPRVCTDAKNPPSAEIAKRYVICGLEQVSGGYTLYLVENVEVQVGGATPYNAASFPYAADIDTESPVYPIRASFDQYQCGQEYKNPSHPLYNLKTNCTIYHIPKSTGYCLKTTFGDWRCSITSREDDANPPRRQMAPPPATASTEDDANPPRRQMAPPTGTDSTDVPARPPTAAAQTGSSGDTGRTVSGGSLNGRATSLPRPAYPAAARALRASGVVIVQVTIDETGKVVSAEAVSGHPLLRASAVQAAYQAQFAPQMLKGKAVKVNGEIMYTFSL